MPAIYGPGCPTKYQSHRTYGTRRGSGRFRRNVAAANVALNSYTLDFNGDALDVEQAAGDMASWPVKVGTATQPGAQKPSFEVAGWPLDGGPAIRFDGVGEAFLGPTGPAAGLQTAWTLSVAQSDSVGYATLFESSPTTNSNDGWHHSCNAADQRTCTAHTNPLNAFNAVASTISDGTAPVVQLAAIDLSQAPAGEIEIWVNGDNRALTVLAGDDNTGVWAAGVQSSIGSRGDGAGNPWDGACRILIVGSGVLTAEQKLSLSSIAMYKARVL